MNEILLIEKNPKFEGLYSLNLRIYLDVGIHSKKKSEFAINFLEKNETKPTMIIVRSMIDKENSALDIINYLKECCCRQANTIFLLCFPNPFKIHIFRETCKIQGKEG